MSLGGEANSISVDGVPYSARVLGTTPGVLDTLVAVLDTSSGQLVTTPAVLNTTIGVLSTMSDDAPWFGWTSSSPASAHPGGIGTVFEK